ncbi:MAG: T9SS type A sorting domain-containing protein [Saprospiraceae bacterium]
MKTLLLSLTFLFALTSALTAQVVIEDFEGTPLGWGGDGTFNGAIDNPDPDQTNMSAQVGSYTKSDMTGFSLLIATLPAPLDLSVNNKISIDVYAAVATKFIFKLEGGGQSFEETINIPVINQWRTYTVDFSSLEDATEIDKIVLFFDPGVEMSGDTYLFDNIVANPADECAGTVPEEGILDDFECQRNVTYGGGFDSLSVIANPDPSGINTSSMVGQYIDPQDLFSALVLDFGDPIDLSTRNQVNFKAWAPKLGNFFVKLEGGVSPSIEITVPVTAVNTWQEYTVDFSDQANANYTRLAIFFNAGVMAEAGDIYYIDDIRLLEGAPDEPIEDFEDGGDLSWEPLNSDAVNHGSFAIIPNPDMSGANTSDNVGEYTKGNAAFSTVSAFLPDGLDLSNDPQLNLQVWAPDGSESVTLQLSSPISGTRDVTRTIDATMEWIDLSFNFEESSMITDFESVRILFDPGTSASGTVYYFDNLIQGDVTVDLCENVDSLTNYLDDFECQRNVTYLSGADRLNVIPNPDVSEGNSSATVGEYTDPMDAFSALVLDQPGNVDLSLENQFHIKVWAPIAGPMVVKLEGGTSPSIEEMVMITETEQWVEYVIDFSGEEAANHDRVAIFFNFNMVSDMEDVYYIDDIFFTRDSYRGCVSDFETPNTTIGNWQYFANGSLELIKGFEIVENPSPDDLNASENVGEFVKASDAMSFAGMFAALDAPINFRDNKTLRVKVLMDHIGNVGMKVEGAANPMMNPGIELSVPNTKVNEWEEITFDFSAAVDDADYRTLTIFFDLGIEATGEDVTSYFDDIVIGDGMCTSTGIFNPVNVETFRVFPNPTSSNLWVEKTADITSLIVYDAFGRELRRIATDRLEYRVEVPVSDLPQGVYLLSGLDRTGQLQANGRFVKQ